MSKVKDFIHLFVLQVMLLWQFTNHIMLGGYKMVFNIVLTLWQKIVWRGHVCIYDYSSDHYRQLVD